jgi:hypothetical protein
MEVTRLIKEGLMPITNILLKARNLTLSPVAVVGLGALIVGCNPQPITPPDHKFSPTSGSIITAEPASVSVIGLDAEPVICYTVDGTTPQWNGGDCANKLEPGNRTIALGCGFNQVALVYGGGIESKTATYTVTTPSCIPADVDLWANDEMVNAFADWKIDVQELMNGGEIPIDNTGNWSANCPGGGTVNWDITRPCGNTSCVMHSFTYNNCTHTVPVTVHDYDTDPNFRNAAITLQQDVTLTVNGVIARNVDGFGDGGESGTVDVSGDFVGQVESHISIRNRYPDGGEWSVGCSVNPVDQEVCAPDNQMVRFEFPLWKCKDRVCPEPDDLDTDHDGSWDRADNCPADANADQADADTDGIGDVCDPFHDEDTDGDSHLDKNDNCPDVANFDQNDVDGDDIGNLCDDPTFFVLKQKAYSLCLYGSGGDVSSTGACSRESVNQRWKLISMGGSYVQFENMEHVGQCMTSNGSAWPSVVLASCNAGDHKQHWNLETYGSSNTYPYRLHNRSQNFCVYTDDTGNVHGTLGNCGLAGSASTRKFGLIPDGEFSQQSYRP